MREKDNLIEALDRQNRSLHDLLSAVRGFKAARAESNSLEMWEQELDRDNRAWSYAYHMNGLEELGKVASLVHDILTGPNDLWAKTQLLDALAAAEHYFRSAIQ